MQVCGRLFCSPVKSRSTPADDKYLQNLANTYSNASTWDTKRQVLSIMADLVPFRILQRHLPDITEYRVKAARHDALWYGHGVPVTTTKSPRMRVNRRQLDHFLAFVTSPHVIQDLPFGQKVLMLADGTVLETPNLIRTLIPERIVAQYREYCKEVLSHCAQIPPRPGLPCSGRC